MSLLLYAPWIIEFYLLDKLIAMDPNTSEAHPSAMRHANECFAKLTQYVNISSLTPLSSRAIEDQI